MARNLSAHEKLSADTVLGRMIREMIAAGIRSVVLGSALVLVIPESAAAEQWCVVGDDGSGTASLPPVGCDYEGHHVILDVAPPGTAVAGFTIHRDFTCGGQADACTVQPAPGECEADGGSLGGKADCFGSMLELHLLGYGD
jgi:hypothetical protein